MGHPDRFVTVLHAVAVLAHDPDPCKPVTNVGG